MIHEPTSAGIGGGVNSTSMVLGCYERDIRVDANLFANTGRRDPLRQSEKSATYRHIDRLDSWLVSHGLPGITEVCDERMTLEEECLDQRTLPSIVVGMRSCSDKYKIRPQNRWIAQWQMAKDAWSIGLRVVKIVGFDAGEPWRAKDFSDKKFSVKFPLIEWGWDREGCIAAINRHGLEVPPKSSCFFCPEMREGEILDLRDSEPEKFARALAMESNNTKLVTIKGLARTYSWKQIADYDRDQLSLLPPRADRMPCICTDGE